MIDRLSKGNRPRDRGGRGARRRSRRLVRPSSRHSGRRRPSSTGRSASRDGAPARHDALNRGGRQRPDRRRARALAKAMPDDSDVPDPAAAVVGREDPRAGQQRDAAGGRPARRVRGSADAVVVEGRYFGIANFLGRLRTQAARRTGRCAPRDVCTASTRPVRRAAARRLLQATMTINAYRAAARAPRRRRATTARHRDDLRSSGPGAVMSSVG